MYIPYNFGLNGDRDISYTKFIDDYKEDIYKVFAALYKKYTSKYHDIIIGEMGTVNKNNTEYRNERAKYYVKKTKKSHML